MGTADLLQLAQAFGPAGVFVFYLIWREGSERKERIAREAARIELDKAEVASRERLASSLTALSMVIQGRANV